MNKAELVTALYAKTGMKKNETENALNALIDVVTDALVKGEKVSLVGFGTLEAKSRPARVARNPRTGESVEIPACKTPVFKAGKALKAIVNK